MARNEPTNMDDTIDLRDVIARFEELEEERAALVEAIKEAAEAADPAQDREAYSDTQDRENYSGDDSAQEKLTEANDALTDWDASPEAIEFKQLGELLSDLKGYGGDEQWRGDWYPVTLIRYSYFTDAMRELCEDIGDMPKGFPSYIEIDWEATANNLRVDYSSVEFDGVAYWYR